MGNQPNSLFREIIFFLFHEIIWNMGIQTAKIFIPWNHLDHGDTTSLFYPVSFWIDGEKHWLTREFLYVVLLIRYINFQGNWISLLKKVTTITST